MWATSAVWTRGCAHEWSGENLACLSASIRPSRGGVSMCASRQRWIAGVLISASLGYNMRDGIAAPPTSARPAVVELFTSEGCSSCPAAEAFLGELAQRPDVLALAFHVEYWDDLGW